MREILSTISLGRIGTSLGMAFCAIFLGICDSEYVIGAKLLIDGGNLAGSASNYLYPGDYTRF